MSDSALPHRQKPTRLPCPWDSPGKKTGVGCHFLLQCMKVKSESEDTQSCLTLCDPMDCNPSGSSVQGILQARRLEWVAIPYSTDLADPRTKSPFCYVHPALAGGFFTTSATWKTPKLSRKKESEVAESCPILCNPVDCKPTRLLPLWNFPGKGAGVGWPFPSPGDLPDPGIEPGSPALWADALPSEPPGKSQYHLLINYFEKIFLNITLHKNFRIFLPTDFCFFFFWKDTAVQFLFQRKYFWFIFIILRFPMSDYRF